MMHSVTGKLNRPARTFQAGESTGFGISLGVQYQDPKTKQKEWTNYQATLFAKHPNKVSYYQSVLVEGAIVTVSAKQLKADAFQGGDGVAKLFINMLNCDLEYAYNPNAQQGGYQAPAQQPAAPQVGYQQQAPAQNFQQPAAQPQGAPQGGGFDDFNDSIPFSNYELRTL